MLIGDHPLKADVGATFCYYGWVIECDYKAPGQTERERCTHLCRVRCDGGPHILLGEAFAACFGRGWTLLPDGTGWRCPDHKDAPMTAPPRRKKSKRGAS